MKQGIDTVTIRTVFRSHFDENIYRQCYKCYYRTLFYTDFDGITIIVRSVHTHGFICLSVWYILADHVTLNFARSGGPGGQNVNKGLTFSSLHSCINACISFTCLPAFSFFQ